MSIEKEKEITKLLIKHTHEDNLDWDYVESDPPKTHKNKYIAKVGPYEFEINDTDHWSSIQIRHGESRFSMKGILVDELVKSVRFKVGGSAKLKDDIINKLNRLN